MFHIQIFYPQSARFDMAYYCEKHMPMVQARIGAACTGSVSAIYHFPTTLGRWLTGIEQSLVPTGD